MEVSVEVRTCLVDPCCYRGVVAIMIAEEERVANFEFELGSYGRPEQYLIVFRAPDSQHARKRLFFSLAGPISAGRLDRRLCALLIRLCRNGLAKTLYELKQKPQLVRPEAHFSDKQKFGSRDEEKIRRLLAW